ncbi:MAG: TauD/TfdA family dioxygenase [Tistlia sp.]|uniref:TauD/TfdA dioxygenase family protein n=1 Tax=Tistlia sp. TaxID=3057121 RepID=UPI0034A509B8
MSFQTEGSRTSATPLTEEQKRQVRNVYHPLVLPHPATGRKALYAVAGSSFGIVGMEDEAALGLLDELKQHATQERYRYANPYAAGDLVIWDNWATLHSASLIEPATGPKDSRLLHRISVKGKPNLEASGGQG